MGKIFMDASEEKKVCRFKFCNHIVLYFYTISSVFFRDASDISMEVRFQENQLSYGEQPRNSRNSRKFLPI